MSEYVILLDCRISGDCQVRHLLGPWLEASRAPAQWVLHLQARDVGSHTWLEICIEELVGDALARVIHGPVTVAEDGTTTALLFDFTGGRARASVRIRSRERGQTPQDGATAPIWLTASLRGD